MAKIGKSFMECIEFGAQLSWSRISFTLYLILSNTDRRRDKFWFLVAMKHETHFTYTHTHTYSNKYGKMIDERERDVVHRGRSVKRITQHSNRVNLNNGHWKHFHFTASNSLNTVLCRLFRFHPCLNFEYQM